MTVSLNFWFPVEDSSVSSENSKGFTDHVDVGKNSGTEEHLLQLMREVELAIGNNLKDVKQVANF